MSTVMSRTGFTVSVIGLLAHKCHGSADDLTNMMGKMSIADRLARLESQDGFGTHGLKFQVNSLEEVRKRINASRAEMSCSYDSAESNASVKDKVLIYGLTDIAELGIRTPDELKVLRDGLTTQNERIPQGPTYRMIENLTEKAIQYSQQQGDMDTDEVPLSLEEIRARLPAEGDAKTLIPLIAKSVLLTREAKIVVAKNLDEFVRAYADDLSARYRVSDNYNAEYDEDLYDAAYQQITDNQCKGFSCLDDSVWMLEGAVESDLLHECIHILSTKGGQGPWYYALGNYANEGVTQYMTTLVCEELGVECMERYPKEVAHTQTICESASVGFQLVYRAYFKGEVDAFLDHMAMVWTNRYKAKLAPGESPTWKLRREIEMSQDQKKAEIVKRLRNNFLSDKHFGYIQERCL